jgi:TetR/AcrR family transcriptional regulator, transcriptional repressor for nem operon
MARPREFDRTKALERAMELFWKQGYEATSIHDLGMHLGLQPGSLYNAFKDKHSLFLEALGCYNEREHEVACRFFAEPYRGLEAIRRFFLFVVESDLSDPDYKGCFMVNAAAELASHDTEVRTKVEQSRSQMTTLFRQALVQAQQGGEISPDSKIDTLALFLTNSLFGLRVTAKVVRERSALLAIVDTLMGSLR